MPCWAVTKIETSIYCLKSYYRNFCNALLERLDVNVTIYVKFKTWNTIKLI